MDQPEENSTPSNARLLNQVAGRMRIFAYLLIASVTLPAIVSGFSFFTDASFSALATGSFAANAISAVVYLIIAFLTLSASGALRAASRTSCDEVSHVIHALDLMRRLFGIQYWLIIVSLALIVLAVIVTVLAFVRMS
ncbi:MAG: hypothetical protein P1U77_15680 [Rubripirellula sp.]|nr:hypothetical protein [Rubripirellula sp.]